MSEFMERRRLEADPFGLDDGPSWITRPLLLARLIGMTGLLLYGLWAFGQVTGDIAALMAAEERALVSLGDEIAGAGMTRAGPAAAVGPAIAWIVACVLSILYLTIVSHRWIKVIVTHWVWVASNLASPSWWDKLWGVIGMVLTAIETAFWIVVTVVAVVVTVINIATLVKVLL